MKRAHYNTMVLIITILLIGHIFLRLILHPQVKSLKTVALALPHLAPNSSRNFSTKGNIRVFIVVYLSYFKKLKFITHTYDTFP